MVLVVDPDQLRSIVAHQRDHRLQGSGNEPLPPRRCRWSLPPAWSPTVCGVLQSEVLAASNARAAELKADDQGQPRRPCSGRIGPTGVGCSARATTSTTTPSWTRNASGAPSSLQIFKLDANYRLTDQPVGPESDLSSEDGWWTLSSGWSRSLERLADETEFVRPSTSLSKVSTWGKIPEYFRGGLLGSRMRWTTASFDDYIDDLKQQLARTSPNSRWRSTIRAAYPVITLVMALVALTLRLSSLGRQGASVRHRPLA